MSWQGIFALLGAAAVVLSCWPWSRFQRER